MCEKPTVGVGIETPLVLREENKLTSCAGALLFQPITSIHTWPFCTDLLFHSHREQQHNSSGPSFSEQGGESQTHQQFHLLSQILKTGFS